MWPRLCHTHTKHWQPKSIWFTIEGTLCDFKSKGVGAAIADVFGRPYNDPEIYREMGKPKSLHLANLSKKWQVPYDAAVPIFTKIHAQKMQCQIFPNVLRIIEKSQDQRIPVGVLSSNPTSILTQYLWHWRKQGFTPDWLVTMNENEITTQMRDFLSMHQQVPAHALFVGNNSCVEKQMAQDYGMPFCSVSDY